MSGARKICAESMVRGAPIYNCYDWAPGLSQSSIGKIKLWQKARILSVNNVVWCNDTVVASSATL